MTRWHGVADSAELAAEATRRVLVSAETALAARGCFLLVLAGGSTPRATYRRLAQARTDWARWHVFYGDERCLPPEDPDRNSRMASIAWLDHVPIPRSQRHPILAELGAEAGAAHYNALLAGTGAFDCVLLGLGEDGHTASLFPGHDLGTGADAPDALAVHQAPKAPSDRVSLSARRLSQARRVLFLISGTGKRDALARWRAGAEIPAKAIRPARGIDVLTETGLLRD